MRAYVNENITRNNFNLIGEKMDTERISELSKEYNVPIDYVNYLCNEIKQEIKAEASIEADRAAQRRVEQLAKADEALKAGNTAESIRLRRDAYGIQTR